jgi:peptidyl-prolyl cis-trans isomerase SurA
VVAIVDNDVVMQSQLDQRVHEVQQTIAKRGGGVPPTGALEQQVLERLIVENLQLQIGERSGIRITDEELNQAVGTIAQRNNMSPEQFRAALAHDGLSFDDARDQIKREMIISRVRQRRVAERIQVSEQEVKNFLNSDLGKMQMSEEYRLANILIPTPESANSTPSRRLPQAGEVYQQLKQGADFGKLAIARSASDNALEGGDMGWRKAGQLPPTSPRCSAAWRSATSPSLFASPTASSSSSSRRSAVAASVLRDEVHVRHILIKPSEIRKKPPRNWLKNCTTASERRRLRHPGQELLGRPGLGAQRRRPELDRPEQPGTGVPRVMADAAKAWCPSRSRPSTAGTCWKCWAAAPPTAPSQAREQQAMSVLRNRKYDEELQTWLRQIRDEAYVEIKLPGADQATQ